jgi:hypothetical protein
MPRAILKGGVIYPVEPLPPEWGDGREVWVDDAAPDSPADIDKWYSELQALAAQIDPEDQKRLEKALAEADEQAKAVVRREMAYRFAARPDAL